MKKDGLLAEILNAVVSHEKKKVRTSKPDYYLNQKKQLWYGLMNSLEPETDPPETDAPGRGEAGDEARRDAPGER